ncbi:uncharacterized protein B4U80_10405 [Leptotrombidium deliense]|uniref:Cx9C motif-containing protein 4 n=1 Tax=Leptotrombidium deliense TaxID=299467 RepID=A0A443SNN7_9ACAR|nr:uncharacterized protein B4U80_10405 [Leptotrombidium deliense]
MSKKVIDPCKSKACDIQTCLQKNNYEEEQCIKEMFVMFECCKRWREISNSCSGFSNEVIDAKIKQYSKVHKS